MPLHFCACFKPWPVFPPSYIAVFFVFNDLRRDEVACFVDIGGIILFKPYILKTVRAIQKVSSYGIKRILYRTYKIKHGWKINSPNTKTENTFIWYIMFLWLIPNHNKKKTHTHTLYREQSNKQVRFQLVQWFLRWRVECKNRWRMTMDAKWWQYLTWTLDL